MFGAISKVTLALLLSIGVVIPPTSLLAQDRGQETHGWMGIYIRNLDQNDHETLGLKRGMKGVVVSGVDDEGPAGEAGLEPGDLITAINGKKVRSRNALLQQLREYQAGDKIRVKVAREKKSMNFELKLEDRPVELERRFRGLDLHADDPVIHFGGRGFKNNGDLRVFHLGGPRLGVQTLDLVEDDLADYFGVESGEGILVTGVQKDGGAEKAGLKPGDVLLKLEDETVTNTADLRQILSEFEDGDKVAVTVLRKKQEKELQVELVGSDLDFSGNFNLQLPRFSRGTGGGRLHDDMGDLRQELRQLRRDLKDLERELHRKR